MIESASNSFIPKRNPGSKPRKARTQNVFLLSIISYALFVSAPLASAGVFIYKLQAEKNESSAITELDNAIVTFNQADFERVVKYQERLKRAEYLVDSHVSISTLMKALSEATAQTVQFKDLEIARIDNSNVAVKAALRTGSLDGVLFQRGQYRATSEISNTEFAQIKFTTPTEDSAGVISNSSEVNLNAEFNFMADEIRYVPVSIQTQNNFVEPDPYQTDSSATPEAVNETSL